MFDYAVVTRQNCSDAVAVDVRHAGIRRFKALDARCHHGFKNGLGSADQCRRFEGSVRGHRERCSPEFLLVRNLGCAGHRRRRAALAYSHPWEDTFFRSIGHRTVRKWFTPPRNRRRDAMLSTWTFTKLI